MAVVAAEELAEDGAQFGELAATGAEQVEEVFDGPGGEDAGAGSSIVAV
ncbi:hypothetical protein ACIA8H_32140 [Streptomyces goshikiensis]